MYLAENKKEWESEVEGVVNIWGDFCSPKRKKVISHPGRRSDPLKNCKRSCLAWDKNMRMTSLFDSNMCFLLEKKQELYSAIKKCECMKLLKRRKWSTGNLLQSIKKEILSGPTF